MFLKMKTKGNERGATMSFTLSDTYYSPEDAWLMIHVYHEEFEEYWIKAIAGMYRD